MERMKKVRMIPTPKRVSESGGRFPYKTELCLLHREFEEAAEVLCPQTGPAFYYKRKRSHTDYTRRGARAGGISAFCRKR